MIYVHGGGWKHGDRTYVQYKPNLFVKAGYVFVSIDYRMLPKVDVATEAKDVEAAYAWVKANIAKFGGDPARIAVMGHSAGSHLVALTGLRGGLPGAKALFFDDVEAYDLQALSDKGHMRRIYGDAFSDPSQWHELSPSTYASRGGHAPILIAYSKVKGHKEASESLAEKLKSAGDQVELFDGTQYTHGEINRGIGSTATAMTDALMAFLKKHVG
jgi:acetyl esterase/lipase